MKLKFFRRFTQPYLFRSKGWDVSIFQLVTVSFDTRPLLRVLVIGVGLTSLLVACHSDRRESFYASLADAKKEGAIDRGWIPDDLPDSSRAIHELHDMSPSTTWCAFEFLLTDSPGLRKRLKKADVPSPSVKRVPSPGKLWWPGVLEGNLDLEKIHRAGFKIFNVVVPETPSTTEEILYAIDWAKGRGFFYRTRG